MTDLKQAKEEIESQITQTGIQIENFKHMIKSGKQRLSVLHSKLKKIDKLIEEANKVME